LARCPRHVSLAGKAEKVIQLLQFHGAHSYVSVKMIEFINIYYLF
jgi:hypothetical protein